MEASRPSRARSRLEDGSRSGMEMKNGVHSFSVFSWRAVVWVERVYFVLYFAVPGMKLALLLKVVSVLEGVMVMIMMCAFSCFFRLVS